MTTKTHSENHTSPKPHDHSADSDNIKLEPSWKQRLVEEFKQPYMQKLRAYLGAEYAKGRTIYPKKTEIFQALNLTPFDKVKVVIIGQDPYHGPDQAHGLCFSVRPGIPTPPSLQNIFKELKTEFNMPIPKTGDLRPWATQGVLLLNAVLTVEAHKAASHQNQGWEIFTDKIISTLSQEREHLVFLLWGSFAQKKAALIDQKKHLILTSAHPSPLSSHRGFFGNNHFKKTNEYLEKMGETPIKWAAVNESHQ